MSVRVRVVLHAEIQTIFHSEHMKASKSAVVMAAMMGLTVFVPFVSGESALESNLNLIEHWVEVEKTISREKADWEIQRQSLKDVVSVYEKELEMLNERIADAAALTSSADSKREALLEEQGQISKAEDVIERSIKQQEALMLKLLSRLPEPLVQEIRPLSQRIPQPGADTVLSLSQRLQNIVGILTQVDKFNTTVEVIPDQRDFGDGSVVEVSTIYLGLGTALYADKSGHHAGSGSVSADGVWTWEPHDDWAPAILAMIRMYQGATNEIRFVPVPVEIQ